MTICGSNGAPLVVPPTSTRITSPYGPRRSSADGLTRMHNGVDLAGADGRTPVVAVADGVVVHATANGARGFSCYGIVVVIHHPALNVWTLSAHLASTSVARGDVVEAGQQIGLVGSTNGSPAHPGTTFRDGRCMPGGRFEQRNRGSGPHLHFEVSPRSYPLPHAAERIAPIEWLESHGARYTSRQRGGRPAATQAPASSGDGDPPAGRNGNGGGVVLLAVGGLALAAAAARRKR